MKVLVLKIMVALFLTGCTSKDVYNIIQNNGKRMCENGPPGQYDECMAQYSESYESYKKSRDKLLKESAGKS